MTITHKLAFSVLNLEPQTCSEQTFSSLNICGELDENSRLGKLDLFQCYFKWPDLMYLQDLHEQRREWEKLSNSVKEILWLL